MTEPTSPNVITEILRIEESNRQKPVLLTPRLYPLPAGTMAGKAGVPVVFYRWGFDECHPIDPRSIESDSHV